MKISKHTADHYLWGDKCDGWHLLRGSDLSVIHERMPPHTSEVKHFHNKAKQFFFVLSGTAVMEVEGEEVVLLPQEGIEIAPLVPHQMFNKSDEEIEFLVVSQPNSHGDRVVVEDNEEE